MSLLLSGNGTFADPFYLNLKDTFVQSVVHLKIDFKVIITKPYVLIHK
jgi:hypothetical protein